MTKTIVFTSMVADLFHFGHLELLRRCRDLGDFLVVGIIRDEEVLRYKKRMPVIPFNQRLEIVRNIAFVDDVISQDSRDGSKNLRKLGNVDLLVRGDDVILDQEVGTIKELGGKFVQLKRTPDISTSSIIGRIKNKY